MKITQKALNFLKEERRTELFLIETEIPTCCSTIRKPHISYIDDESMFEDSDVSKFSVGKIIIYVHNNAQKYWESATLDLMDRFGLKSLIVSLPSDRSSNCCS